MAGVKGRSGTNKGKDKPWAEALRLVVFRDDTEGKRRLQKIAEQCAALAESGDMQAIKEIGDRLDGRPLQESHHTVDRTAPREMTDAELAAILAGADRSGEGDSSPPIDPAKLN